MSASAEAIVEQVKKLSPVEFAELMGAIRQLAQEREAQRAAQLESIRRERGMFAGSGLLQALLESRAEDRLKEREQDEARLRDRQSRDERRSLASLPSDKREQARVRAKLALHPPA